MGKPILLATGASDFYDTSEALDLIFKNNNDVCLMQCNTNYTGDIENFKYVNLNVLKTFSNAYPGLPLGLSDHTPGHSAVLGSISLGARVIEKHFTDDNQRVGPDHHFAMNPQTWREMIDASQELFYSLGDGIKRIEDNEKDTVIIQRRAIRASQDLKKGDKIDLSNIEFLRPCPSDAINPMKYEDTLGKDINRDIQKGDYLRYEDLK